MTQAVLNVMGKERYATVPDEVRKYVLGYYGEIAGPIDPNIFDRITKGRRARHGASGRSARAGHRTPATRARTVQVRRRSAARSVLSGYEYKALKAAGPIKTEYPLASTPLETLVKEIALRSDIKSFSFSRRRAGLTE